MTNQAENKEVHIWEANGLGRAPFKFLFVYELPSPTLAEQNPTAYNNALAMMPCPCGSCQACGMPLTYNYIIEDADKKIFPVGCECVYKAGHKHMTTEVKEAKKRLDREKRQAKKEEQLLARLQVQREKNGGMTDSELMDHNWKIEQEKKKQALAPVIEILAPLAVLLSDGKCGFCDDIADGLLEGRLPYGRGLGIMIEIIAKKSGRTGSKAYNAECDRINLVIDRAQELIPAK